MGGKTTLFGQRTISGGELFGEATIRMTWILLGLTHSLSASGCSQHLVIVPTHRDKEVLHATSKLVVVVMVELLLHVHRCTMLLLRLL